MSSRRRGVPIGFPSYFEDDMASKDFHPLTGRRLPGRRHKDIGVVCSQESIVQQHLRDEVDVNTIVKRFGLTGQMPLAVAQGVYADFSDVHDYASAAAAIGRANEGFMALPADVRERFRNDPGMLVQKAMELEPEAFEKLMQPVVPAAVPPNGGVVPPVEPAS